MPEPILHIPLSSDLSIEMILVEGGAFLMGESDSDYSVERPVHPVEVSAFYMAKFPVTQEIWSVIMRTNPSRFKGERRPVDSVSWQNVQSFIKKLNQLTGLVFRLPSEAEWEYSARGGRYSQGYIYAGSDKLKQVGWYNENSNGETHEVGRMSKNELGIYDMSGNVYEWCEDDFYINYEGAPKDGSAWIHRPARVALRVLRGGGYFSRAVLCRNAFRSYAEPRSREYFGGIIGFRVVLPLKCLEMLDGFH